MIQEIWHSGTRDVLFGFLLRSSPETVRLNDLDLRTYDLRIDKNEQIGGMGFRDLNLGF